MHLIVGLGNPGTRYRLTRHNIGFLCIEKLAELLGSANSFKEEHKALVTKIKIKENTTLLAMPQTYMNLSGESVRAIMAFYKIPLNNILIIQDDVDVAFLRMKYQKNRGAGGNNGIKSITECLGTQDYARLKLGVGRPIIEGQSTADYVLQNFSKDEQMKLINFLDVASLSAISFVLNGFEKTSGEFNQHPMPTPKEIIQDTLEPQTIKKFSNYREIVKSFKNFN